jgi:pimeloyl-ACP methyl ester carboxylesterase
MESREADRSAVTLRDHVDAVVAAIDSCDPDEHVAVVGHSAGCGIAYAAVDARPHRVARAVYVGGFPVGDGGALGADFPAVDGEVPLPDWSEFASEDLADMDEGILAAFRREAVPSPERVTRDPQRLHDERRYDVPVTAVCTEYTSRMLREWVDQGEEPVQELTRIREVEYVDLPTGHWPQLTLPADLAGVILAAVAGPGSDATGSASGSG